MNLELKEEEIVNKVGGRFKLSTLIQKRLASLSTGSKPLVEIRDADRLQIVLQEILQDKIYLDASGNLQSNTNNRTISANLPAAYMNQGHGGKSVPIQEAMPSNDDLE